MPMGDCLSIQVADKKRNRAIPLSPGSYILLPDLHLVVTSKHNLTSYLEDKQTLKRILQGLEATLLQLLQQ